MENIIIDTVACRFCDKKSSSVSDIYGACKDCRYDVSNAHGSIRSLGHWDDVKLVCSKCLKNPVPHNKEREKICILCCPNNDYDPKDEKNYPDNSAAKQNRDTDHMFCLKGYERWSGAEIWHRKTCNYCFAVQKVEPGHQRDHLQDMARFIHAKYACDDYRTGR